MTELTMQPGNGSTLTRITDAVLVRGMPSVFALRGEAAMNGVATDRVMTDEKKTSTVFTARSWSRPCGCKYFADTNQHVFCEAHPGCRRCKDDVILVDTEDWAQPVCWECWNAVGEDPHWHEKKEEA